MMRFHCAFYPVLLYRVAIILFIIYDATYYIYIYIMDDYIHQCPKTGRERQDARQDPAQEEEAARKQLLAEAGRAEDEAEIERVVDQEFANIGQALANLKVTEAASAAAKVKQESRNLQSDENIAQLSLRDLEGLTHETYFRLYKYLGTATSQQEEDVMGRTEFYLAQTRRTIYREGFVEKEREKAAKRKAKEPWQRWWNAAKGDLGLERIAPDMGGVGETPEFADSIKFFKENII
jgi:hypothetical protein